MSEIINFKDLQQKEQDFFRFHVGDYYHNIEEINFCEGRYELLSKMPQGAICAEIGVDEGVTSEHILQSTNPKKMHLIDCWEIVNITSYNQFVANVTHYGDLELAYEKFPSIKYFQKLSQYFNRRHGREKVQARFKERIKNGQVEIHFGYAHKESESFPDKYFDWIFIDGDHSYKGVKRDLEFYMPKVKNGGYILGHDFYSGFKFQGVVRAVNEFCKKYNWKIKILTRDRFVREKKHNVSTFLHMEGDYEPNIIF